MISIMCDNEDYICAILDMQNCPHTNTEVTLYDKAEYTVVKPFRITFARDVHDDGMACC